MKCFVGFLVLACLVALFGCGGGVYEPSPIVIDIHVYDEQTNGIADVRVTYTLTNGTTVTSVTYTFTNGRAEVKETLMRRRDMLVVMSYWEALRLFEITIEDIDGTNNRGEFRSTNFRYNKTHSRAIFMQRR